MLLSDQPIGITSKKKEGVNERSRGYATKIDVVSCGN